MTFWDGDWLVCGNCGEQTRLLTDDPELFKDLKWRFERRHRDCWKKGRRTVN